MYFYLVFPIFELCVLLLCLALQLGKFYSLANVMFRLFSILCLSVYICKNILCKLHFHKNELFLNYLLLYYKLCRFSNVDCHCLSIQLFYENKHKNILSILHLHKCVLFFHVLVLHILYIYPSDMFHPMLNTMMDVYVLLLSHILHIFHLRMFCVYMPKNILNILHLHKCVLFFHVLVLHILYIYPSDNIHPMLNTMMDVYVLLLSHILHIFHLRMFCVYMPKNILNILHLHKCVLFFHVLVLHILYIYPSDNIHPMLNTMMGVYA